MNIYIKKESTYNNILSRKKIIEGRLLRGIFKKISKDFRINFCFKNEKISAKIIDLKKYSSFSEFLKNEKIEHILPDVDNIEEGIKIYNDYYPKNYGYGVIGIRFDLI